MYLSYIVYSSFTVVDPTGQHCTTDILATGISLHQFRSIAERRRTKQGRSETVVNPMVEKDTEPQKMATTQLLFFGFARWG
jgi:hypothetical protein